MPLDCHRRTRNLFPINFRDSPHAILGVVHIVSIQQSAHDCRCALCCRSSVCLSSGCVKGSLETRRRLGFFHAAHLSEPQSAEAPCGPIDTARPQAFVAVPFPSIGSPASSWPPSSIPSRLCCAQSVDLPADLWLSSKVAPLSSTGTTESRTLRPATLK